MSGPARAWLARVVELLRETSRGAGPLLTVIGSYPADRFHPFTPREVALESFSTYPLCIQWPRPTELYEPPAPTSPASRRPARSPTGPTLAAAGRPQRGHVPSLYGGRYPARDWVREFLRRHG